MNILAELQAWYLSHCDGAWEHAYGIRIDTLDNPEWEVRINLRGTGLEDRPSTLISEIDPEVTCMECHLDDGHFLAHGGPSMLEPMLRVFLDWPSVRAPA